MFLYDGGYGLVVGFVLGFVLGFVVGFGFGSATILEMKRSSAERFSHKRRFFFNRFEEKRATILKKNRQRAFPRVSGVILVSFSSLFRVPSETRFR